MYFGIAEHPRGFCYPFFHGGKNFRENGTPERPQTLRCPENINIFPLNMPRVQRRAFPIVFILVRAQPKAYVQCLIHPLLVGGSDLPGALPQAVFIQRADLL